MNNKTAMKKNTLILLLVICPFFIIGQTTQITLKEAIKKGQENSLAYQEALNTYRSSYWSFRRYKAGFLPLLRMGATFPSYSEEITLVSQDDGSQVYRNRNQIRTDVNLNLRQNVAFTGGTFSIGSSLNRIENFDTNIKGYTFTPFSINYFQDNIFYNPYKWDKKIEPLRYEQSQKAFLENMEKISSRTCRLYFNLLRNQIEIKIGNANLKNQDALLKIARGRFKVGTIAENELLQMELTYLKSKNKLTKDSISLKRASQDLMLYLNIDADNLELKTPEKLEYFTINVDKAISEAKENRKDFLEFKRLILEKEKALARVKGTNKLTIDINARLGRSKGSEDLENALAFNDFNKNQSINVSLGLPILDWGRSKTDRKRAETNLDLEKIRVTQKERDFKQTIEFLVLNWSNQTGLLAVAEKTKEIAIKSYEIAKQRYILGKITITDLNIAQSAMDSANISYLIALQGFWNDYYELRQFTLYDFIKDKKISTKDILFD
jgi:outer membrane protein TolC